jgi:hypothetical protein
LENYLYEDDIIIKSEIIISIFKNIKKITDSEFLNHFENKVKKYLETNFSNEYISFRDKVFFTIIEEIEKYIIPEKTYFTIIKNFIKKFVMINDINKESKDCIYFINSTKLYSMVFIHLEKIDKVFLLHDDQNFMTDFINYLIKVIFDLNGNGSNHNVINNNHINNSNSNQQNSNCSTNLISINIQKDNINGGINNNFCN